MYENPTPLQGCLIARVYVEQFNVAGPEAGPTQINIDMSSEDGKMAAAYYATTYSRHTPSSVDSATVNQAVTALIGAIRVVGTARPHSRAYDAAFETAVRTAQVYGFTEAEGRDLVINGLKGR